MRNRDYTSHGSLTEEIQGLTERCRDLELENTRLRELLNEVDYALRHSTYLPGRPSGDRDMAGLGNKGHENGTSALAPELPDGSSGEPRPDAEGSADGSGAVGTVQQELK